MSRNYRFELPDFSEYDDGYDPCEHCNIDCSESGLCLLLEVEE